MDDDIRLRGRQRTLDVGFADQIELGRANHENVFTAAGSQHVTHVTAEKPGVAGHHYAFAAEIDCHAHSPADAHAARTRPNSGATASAVPWE